VDLDLEKFFDRVNHDKLNGRAIARRVSDKRMLKLIRAFLESGVMENGFGEFRWRKELRKEGLLSPLAVESRARRNSTASWSGASTVSCATRMIAISTWRANGRGSESCKA